MVRPALAAVPRAEDASATLDRRISTRYRPLDRISASEGGTELLTVGRADLLALVKLAGLQIWKAIFKPSRSGRDVQEPVVAKPEKRIAA